jgi:hypothetical protein
MPSENATNGETRCFALFSEEEKVHARGSLFYLSGDKTVRRGASPVK